MRRLSASLVALALAAALPAQAVAQTAPQAIAQPGQQARPLAVRKPLIQVAILLDTSNSMDGLIAQAKTELWRIVNEIAGYRFNGVVPEVQVALYEYGKSSIPGGEGHLRMVSPLVTDLDRISEELFALTTNGGDEYCGMVIDKALEGLQWSAHPDDYKAIFIAGNEPFTQGKVDYREAVAKAKRKGVVVNTIHCGGVDEGVRGMWRDGADLGGGSYMSIDQGLAQVAIATPYDRELAELGRKLNDTYIGYGRGGKGQAMKARQAKQDANSQSAGGSAAVERASAKAKSVYANEDWDLVDAKKKGKVGGLGKVAKEELPEEMKNMNEAEREAYVAGKAKDREALQKKIAELDEKRRKFIAAEQAKQSLKENATFDAAMRKTLKGQMERKAFKAEQK